MVDLINASVGGGVGPIAYGNLSSKSADIALPAAASSVSMPQASAQAQTSIDIPNDSVTQELLQKRTSALKEAISASLPKFFYPVSDVRFTIYKDSSGEYNVAVTNIRTGAKSLITYPQIADQFAEIGGGGNISTSA